MHSEVWGGEVGLTNHSNTVHENSGWGGGLL